MTPADWLLAQFDAAKAGPGEFSAHRYLNQHNPRPVPTGRSMLSAPAPTEHVQVVEDVPPVHATWDLAEAWEVPW